MGVIEFPTIEHASVAKHVCYKTQRKENNRSSQIATFIASLSPISMRARLSYSQSVARITFISIIRLLSLEKQKGNQPLLRIASGHARIVSSVKWMKRVTLHKKNASHHVVNLDNKTKSRTPVDTNQSVQMSQNQRRCLLPVVFERESHHPFHQPSTAKSHHQVVCGGEQRHAVFVWHPIGVHWGWRTKLTFTQGDRASSLRICGVKVKLTQKKF